MNGVIISVPTNSHYEIAFKCLKKGFNIFIEKPSTNSSKKLKKLHKIALSKKLIIMSGYIYLYNDHIKYIKKIIKKIFLEKFFYVSCERLNLGPVRNDVSSAWICLHMTLQYAIIYLKITYQLSKKVDTTF